MRLPLVVLSCGCGALLWATDFVVPSGTTVTTTQTLSTAGDEGVIEQGGAIQVDSVNGVAMNAANQSVLNAGTIRLVDNDVNAPDGIRSIGASASIVNRGTISTTGENNSGIDSRGGLASISNSGTISATGLDASGVFLDNSSSRIVNSGIISVTGRRASAVFIFSGGENTLVNSGMISVNGTSSSAVFLQSDSNTIVNSGMISATGTSSVAVDTTGSPALIVNSGTIKGPTALSFTGANPTLSLLLGSNIQGVVSTVEALNLNVQEGLNLRLTIEEQNGFGRLNIGSPYITVGNTETIAVVDRTGFTMQADVLEDLSDSVLDSIYRGKYDYLHCCDLHCGG